MLAAGPAAASRGDAASLRQYMWVRLSNDVDSAGYAALLTANPDDPATAFRAYRGAMVAGDTALALRAAKLLDAKGVLPAEGLLLLAGEALAAGDWRGARLAIDRLERAQAFDFLAPILRGWTDFGAGDGAATAPLDGPMTGLTAAYAREQRALILLAQGQGREGAGILRVLSGGQKSVSGDALRIAAATRLVQLRLPDLALGLLDADDPDLQAARALVSRRRPPGAAADTPGRGVALLLARLAEDIGRQQPTPISVSLVRIAAMLDPENDAFPLLAARMLAADGGSAAALAALDRIKPKSLWSRASRNARIGVLAAQGQAGAALAAATAATQERGATDDDWTRLGGVLVSLGRHADAAQAYDRAIALSGPPGWTLWMLKGGALERAGDWANAKPALVRAVALAPDQPVALNYLGYAMLERGDDLDEAERLIVRAAALRPDDSAITDSLGWAYYTRGDIPKAIAALEKAVEGEPAEPAINEHLGDAYWAAGRRIEARYAWRAALLGAEGEQAARINAKIDTGPPAPR